MKLVCGNALNYIDSLIEYLDLFDKIFIFSDFDGTLVRFKKNPCEVRLSKKAFYALEKISKNSKIITAIVSGRKISELEFFLGNNLLKNLNLFGCHGSEIKFKNMDIEIAAEALESNKSIKSIQDIIEKKFINTSGIIFEKKENSFAVNYRNILNSEKKKIEDLKDAFLEFEKKYPVRFLDLKKVFEIVPHNINKSFAIKATVKKYCKTLKENSYVILCIGDDITDENLFMGNVNGINIKVGVASLSNTNANFFLNNINEVIMFLNKISYIN
ncbi:trehalose-phosphatase [bacterium]|nr:trehalose-phosphatase [bacterium]